MSTDTSKPEVAKEGTKQDILKNADSWYSILDMFLGLNDKVEAKLASDPELAKMTLARVRDIGADATKKLAEVSTQKLMESMSIQEKAALLLSDFFGDWIFKAKGAFEFEPAESIKKMYDDLLTGANTLKTKVVEGYPHIMTPPDFFKSLNVDFFKTEAQNFPLPLGACVVLDEQFSPFALHMLQKSAEAAGKTVKVLLPTEVQEVGKPSSDEVHVVLSPSPADLQKKVDWNTVATYAELWEEKSVPLVGICPEMVAAIQAFKGQTPEEACKTAGIENPKPEFLTQLSTPVHPVVEAPAAPVAPAETPAAVEPKISDPDDLRETL